MPVLQTGAFDRLATSRISGSPSRHRTCDIGINSAALYQLSYRRKKEWQTEKDSNLRMPESKSGALDQLGDRPK